MRRFLGQRWVWVVAMFAVINVLGLGVIGWMVVGGSGGLKVEEFSPGAETAAVNAAILLRFDQPMVPPAEVDSAVGPNLVSMRPHVAGEFVWRDVRTLMFQPDEDLATATGYEVIVAPQMTSLLGHSMDDEQLFSFRTPPLMLVGAKQVEMTPDGRLTLTLEFNNEVTPADLAAHLSVTLAAPWSEDVLDWNVVSAEPGRSILLRTKPVGNAESVFVCITEGLLGVEGELGMETAISCEVPVSAGMSIGSVEGRSWYDGTMAMVVDCTQRVGDAGPFVSVEPQVEGLHCEERWGGFSINGKFTPGLRYRVTIGRGMRGNSGTTLTRDVTRSVMMPDLTPRLTLSAAGEYLAARGGRVLPLESVNIARVKLTIERIYANNLVHYSRRKWSSDGMARVVKTKTLAPGGRLNEIVTTKLDLRELLGKDARGAYYFSVRDAKTGWQQSAQLVYVTDLGVSVKRTERELLAWVCNLATGLPVLGATIRVFSRTNQELLVGATDESGIVRFQDVEWPNDERPWGVAVENGDDLTFVALGEAVLTTSSFDVSGRPYLSDGYEAFLYGDRGIYRPGETVQLHGIVRGADQHAPGAFPVELKVTRPDGQVLERRAAILSEWGSVDVALSLTDYAMTGGYRVALCLPGGKVLGRSTFRVEEFVPNRLKVEVAADERRYVTGESLAVTLRGMQLHGSPAAGRRVTARRRIVGRAFAHPDWAGYDFEDSAKPTGVVGEKGMSCDPLDAQGLRVLNVELPQGAAPPSALRVIVTATVHEIGGRGVTTSLARDVDPYPFYVGLKRAASDGFGVGEPVRFECALVKPDGTPVAARRLVGSVCRVIWRSTWVQEDGRARWKSTPVVKVLDEVACTITDGRGAVSFTPRTVGQFRIHLRDEETGASADLKFYASGGRYTPWSQERPSRVELVSDKARYAPGETALVMIKSPIEGKVLVTVESDRIHHAEVLTQIGTTGKLGLPVDASWGPNVYCTVTIVAPLAEAGRPLVTRAYGVTPLRLDCTPQRLQVDLTAPETVRPEGPTHVQVRVTNAAGEPVEAELTLAAVDEGIHALSGYRARDPWDFFYAKRALPVRWSDVYSKLMPEVDAPLAVDRSEAGGGSFATGPRLLNPISAPRVRPVALWRYGIVTDADGRADVSLDLPRFDGKLRLVAIAASGRLFGMGEGGITVRKPLMVRASLPRVLAPGDEFEVPVTVFNHTGADGDATVFFSEQGGVEVVTNAEPVVALADATDGVVRYRLRAPSVPGVVKILFSAQLGDESDVEEVEIAVRPPNGLSYKSGCVAVDAGKISRINIPGDWLPGTEKFSLTCAPKPWLSLGAGLRYVMRYPYGCLEQTTSSVFPLLYLADVASALEPDTLEREDAAPFVQAGIARIAAMQRSDGGFSMWMSGGRAWGWGSAYATHFLVEAKKAGYVVPARTLDRALSFMRRRCGRNGDDSSELESRAYACFVQALAGRADVAQTWRLFEDRKALTPTARFLMAGAMAHMGETGDADGILRAASLPEADDAVATGGSLHSSTREAALLLSIYMDRNPEHKNVPLLVQRLTQTMTNGRWRSTQENAYALLGLGKYMRRMHKADTTYEATLRMPDGASKSFTHKEPARLELGEAGDVEVELKGTGRMFAFWTAEGVPLRAETPNVDAGLRVRRRFLSRDGKLLDVKRIPHGEVVVVELTIASERDLKNVVLVDLLPAGFEIENPRLNGRDGSLPDVGTSLNCNNVEMRDDRLIACVGYLNGRDHSRPYVYRYVVRAVTIGEFALPAVSAHCMYQPAVQSTHGAGRVTVVAR